MFITLASITGIKVVSSEVIPTKSIVKNSLVNLESTAARDPYFLKQMTPFKLLNMTEKSRIKPVYEEITSTTTSTTSSTSSIVNDIFILEPDDYSD